VAAAIIDAKNATAIKRADFALMVVFIPDLLLVNS